MRPCPQTVCPVLLPSRRLPVCRVFSLFWNRSSGYASTFVDPFPNPLGWLPGSADRSGHPNHPGGFCPLLGHPAGSPEDTPSPPPLAGPSGGAVFAGRQMAFSDGGGGGGGGDRRPSLVSARAAAGEHAVVVFRAYQHRYSAARRVCLCVCEGGRASEPELQSVCGRYGRAASSVRAQSPACAASAPRGDAHTESSYSCRAPDGRAGTRSRERDRRIQTGETRDGDRWTGVGRITVTGL